jgi:hypothetical protein
MIVAPVETLVNGDIVRLGDSTVEVLCLEELPNNYKIGCFGGRDTPCHIIVRLEQERFIVMPKLVCVELAQQQRWNGTDVHIHVDNMDGNDRNSGAIPEYSIASMKRQFEIAREARGARVICHTHGRIGMGTDHYGMDNWG